MRDDRPALSTTAGWHPAAAAALVAVAILSAYARVLRELVVDWATDGDYSHAFLVVPFAAYLAWGRRHELARAEVDARALGLVIALLSLALFGAGTLAVEQFVTRVSLIGVIAGAILFVCGPRHLAILAFPLLLLLATIPLPAIALNAVALPLQSLAAQTAAGLLAIADIPVLREGHVLRLPRSALEVADACSGLRSLVALVTLGLVAGHLSGQRLGRRVVLVAMTIPIAVAANAVRVASLGVAAYAYGVDVDRSAIHTLAGWGVFAITLALLLGVQNVLLWRPHVAREMPPC